MTHLLVAGLGNEVGGAKPVGMRSKRFLLGVAVGLLAMLSRGAAAPVELGLSRDDVIQKHGKPISTAGKGAREFLTYPDGRVILENGVVTAFEPKGGAARAAAASNSSASAAPAAAPVAPDPMQPRADARAANAGWLSSMDEAVAKATAANKPILFLLSGNMDACPWGKMFSERVEYSDRFIRKIQADYVPLRINLSEMGGSFEASSKEEVDRMAEKFKAFEKMRAEVFSTQEIPGLAILSPDGKQSTELDMSGALDAVKRGKLDEYTLAQMTAARDAPRKEIKAYQASGGKIRLLYMAGGLVLLALLIKKLVG